MLYTTGILLSILFGCRTALLLRPTLVGGTNLWCNLLLFTMACFLSHLRPMRFLLWLFVISMINIIFLDIVIVLIAFFDDVITINWLWDHVISIHQSWDDVIIIHRLWVFFNHPWFQAFIFFADNEKLLLTFGDSFILARQLSAFFNLGIIFRFRFGLQLLFFNSETFL